MKTRITEKIKSVLKRDKEVMLTTARVSYPFIVERADGDYAYDISGNRFIDFSSFVGVYNLGLNGNKEVRNAVKAQIDKLSHPAFTDYYSELPVSFSEKLVGMFPKGFGRVFLSNSGTEANEAALKFSKLFTKRQYIISFYGSFHGRTMGSLSITASKAVHREHFGPFNSTIQAQFSYPYRCPLRKDGSSSCLCGIDYIRDIIFKKQISPSEVAAIFMEPIQGEGGYIVPDKEFVVELRKLATENGILLVSDEIQSGYMRTGRFLALDNFGVEADIYTMAKGLGGGMPIGATITRRSLGDIPRGSHGTTFGGNHISVAAANASLDYLNRNMHRLKRDVKEKGSIIMKRLNEMKERYGIIGDARGIGMMIGAELVKSRKTKAPAVEERERVLNECFNNGLLLLPAGVSTIRIIPPITISKSNLNEGLDIFESSLKLVSG